MYLSNERPHDRQAQLRATHFQKLYDNIMNTSTNNFSSYSLRLWRHFKMASMTLFAVIVSEKCSAHQWMRSRIQNTTVQYISLSFDIHFERFFASFQFSSGWWNLHDSRKTGSVSSTERRQRSGNERKTEEETSRPTFPRRSYPVIIFVRSSWQ